MLKNFFLIAARNIIKNIRFSLLNILGLSIGLGLALLILLFVTYEKSFDRQYKDGDRIYRAYYKIAKPEGNEISATTPPTFAAVLQNFPEVEVSTRTLAIKSLRLFEVAGKHIYETNGAYADSNFLEVFNIELIKGDARTALGGPANIIIDEALAEKYFGRKDVIGQRIDINHGPFTVTGVMKKLTQTHLKLDYILPLSGSGIPAEQFSEWGWYGMTTYVKAKPNVDDQVLSKKLQPFVNQLVNKADGASFTAMFQPLKQIHLYSAEFKYDLSERGNITYVNALLAIALFILVIACFNFINLSTAQSLKRAREVGVKKTLGANRKKFLSIGWPGLI